MNPGEPASTNEKAPLQAHTVVWIGGKQWGGKSIKPGKPGREKIAFLHPNNKTLRPPWRARGL